MWNEHSQKTPFPPSWQKEGDKEFVWQVSQPADERSPFENDGRFAGVENDG